MNEDTDILEFPLVSIIIPCYNQGRFLLDAISSIENLTYPNTETIVIDDGSTDNTPDIAHRFPWVKYFYQSNMGLAFARNAGSALSEGAFLIFLDADDWLYPDAIEKNITYLREKPELAMVSGCHNIAIVNKEVVDEGSDIIDNDHYVHLLYRNYIGNPAAVLYPRKIIQEFPFDTSTEVRACEDYDQYLKISRKYPILHHQGKISVYRKHNENMSGDFQLMLSSVLNVLERQKPFLQNEKERKAWESGRKQWSNRYTGKLYRKFFYEKGLFNLTAGDAKLILHFKKEFFKIFTSNIISNTKSGVKDHSPRFLKNLYDRIKAKSY